MNDENEEFLKLKEELKYVRFADAGHHSPDEMTLEDLQELKAQVDFMRQRKNKQ